MTHSRRLLEEETTESIIGTFFDVHGALGFGYRESIYAAAMERDLRAKGHAVEREFAVLVYYRGHPLAKQVFDMVVDKKVIVEIKATEHLSPSAMPQLFSYLCSTTLEVGLVLHFGHKANVHRAVCENRFKNFSQLPTQ